MRFAIVGLQRTGSSYLVHLLGSHPEIHCCGEIFNTGSLNLRWPKEMERRRETTRALREMRTRDPQEFLEGMFALDFGTRATGFKIFPSQNPAMFERILDDRSIAKIVHSRENGLARYASLRAARATGDFVGYEEKPLVEFKARRFKEFLDEHAAFFDGLERRLTADGQRFHRSRFEDFKYPERMTPILEFLGVAPTLPPLMAPPANTGPSDVLSRFSNPEDAEAYLREHNLMHWARE
ncbi:MAG TPA: sulfotransferase [Rhizomicrobium sp.]|nr:sulfotransferase [Rhizomicrobium sp.]